MKTRRALLVKAKDTRMIDIDRLKYERKLLADKTLAIDYMLGVVSRQLDTLEEQLRWHDFMVFCHTGRFPG